MNLAIESFNSQFFIQLSYKFENLKSGNQWMQLWNGN